MLVRLRMYMVCFCDVFTGVDTRQKKALPLSELHTLLNKDPQTETLRHTQAIANLLFQFGGMPSLIWLIWRSQI